MCVLRTYYMYLNQNYKCPNKSIKKKLVYYIYDQPPCGSCRVRDAKANSLSTVLFPFTD